MTSLGASAGHRCGFALVTTRIRVEGVVDIDRHRASNGGAMGRRRRTMRPPSLVGRRAIGLLSPAVSAEAAQARIGSATTTTASGDGGILADRFAKLPESLRRQERPQLRQRARVVMSTDHAVIGVADPEMFGGAWTRRLRPLPRSARVAGRSRAIRRPMPSHWRACSAGAAAAVVTACGASCRGWCRRSVVWRCSAGG